MIPDSTDKGPSLLHVEPVLAVSDINKTISYWTEVLGFPGKWTWGNPPNHGGVSWHGSAFIQFSLNPPLASVSAGHSVWIRVRNLEALYEQHQGKATIVSPLRTRPWGMAEYIVQDINGYYVSFSAPATDHSSPREIRKFKLAHEVPSFAEYKKLMDSVGWGFDDSTKTQEWESAVYTVVARSHTGEAIGCAFLMGDNISFYYVKDVIVLKDWQGQGVGTAMMQALIGWAEANAPANATIGLFTGDHLARFYSQFGFVQACGMYRQIIRKG